MSEPSKRAPTAKNLNDLFHGHRLLPIVKTTGLRCAIGHAEWDGKNKHHSDANAAPIVAVTASSLADSLALRRIRVIRIGCAI